MRGKLAMIQMRVVCGERDENLARACRLVDQAAGKGAKVVVLPEAMDLGWTQPSAKSQAEPIPQGHACQTLASAAKKNGIYVCAGLIERAGERVFNSAVLINPAGEVVLLHRKINELEIAHDFYAQGDRLGVCETEFGTVGLMICADATAVDCVLTKSLCYMGADIILSPSAWAMPPEHDNEAEPYGQVWLDSYCPVAKDFSVYIAGVSNVGWIEAGPWAGRKCIGCSLLVGPDGQVILTGPYGVDAETILYADIAPTPRPARAATWREYLDERRQ